MRQSTSNRSAIRIRRALLEDGADDLCESMPARLPRPILPSPKALELPAFAEFHRRAVRYGDPRTDLDARMARTAVRQPMAQQNLHPRRKRCRSSSFRACGEGKMQRLQIK